MTNRRRHLIAGARHTCVAAMLFSLLAGAAWGQDAAELRLSTLTSQLKQGDSFVRWRAAKALLRIGSLSKVAVPALIEALKIEEGDISERARDALVKIGPDAVPALIKALKYRDSLAHSKAIQALDAIGPPAVPALIEALKDANEDVRLGALKVLDWTKPTPQAAVPILIELLKDPDPAIRSAAAQNIMCTGAEAAPPSLALIEALKDQDPKVRSAAASALFCVHLAPGHPTVQAALALLLEALKNQDANVRSGAAHALANMGSMAKPALDALIKASKDPDEKVRSNAARALGRIEPAADPVVATLLDALRDSNKNVRSAAASALKSAPARAAIYPLIVALQDSEASVRRNAADSLARSDAGFAVPRLIQLMSDRDTEVRNAASRALEAIGHNAGQALVKASKAKDADIRNRAAIILKKLDPRAALAAHIEALKDRNASVRSSAALSLGSFAYNATVVPALIEALKDPDNRVRYMAAQSVIRVHAEPKQVIPILIAALKDQDPQVRSEAVSALGAVGPDAKAAVPALIDSLGDRNADVLRHTIDALGKISTEATANVIIPRLVRLLNRRDRGIREAAIGALAAIGEPAAPSLAKLLMGQDSYLQVKTYYALVAHGDVSTLIAALKSRDQNLRSLIVEAIDEIREGSMGSAEGTVLLFDPSRKYLFHKSGTGCGYENEGRTIFVSELDSGKSFPILASCNYLTLANFLEYGGKHYLLVAEVNGGAGNPSFWLYDVKANEYVIHAKGEINETKERGVFSYAYSYDEHDALIPAGKVTIKNLINRESPLRLIPMQPMHGLTLRKNTKVFHTPLETCQPDTDSFEIIRNAGTRVLVISKCEDSSYEIYYKGAGHVRKGSLKPTK
ncbi:MAG: HEAT repeat domain-containing protein [Acidobacteriota bacterium]